jgi:hypothetical protein
MKNERGREIIIINEFLRWEQKKKKKKKKKKKILKSGDNNAKTFKKTTEIGRK